MFQTEPRFEAYFAGRLKQVFLYITDECNLRCEQCIYKPSITFQMHPGAIPEATVHGLLSEFRRLGATKLTILGGEPSTYGAHEGNLPLGRVITRAREAGFEYIRMDTNGQWDSAFLDIPGISNLDEIAFSLDGPSAEINDPLRGNGTFEKVQKNLLAAREKGYLTTITCCVQRRLLDRNPSGGYVIEDMMHFAREHGCDTINFHDLFKVGVPMDTWTGDFNPTPLQWVAAYRELKPKVDAGAFGLNVRLPLCFVSKDEFAANPEYFGYCPVKLAERVMVHPNGTIRICSNLICTGMGVGKWTTRNGPRIAWEDTVANEVADHDLNTLTPCTNRSKHRSYGEFVPVCFSFKPDQKEHVWVERLGWERHKRVATVTTAG